MVGSRAWQRATASFATTADLSTKADASALSAKADVSALAAVIDPGTIAAFLRASPPTGWVKANGSTIGSAASGATRANADTAALFEVLWNISAFAILTSAGAGSTRGASAAADFAANKRLTLPDLRGEFIRGWADDRTVDTSRALGSTQAEAIGPHTHSVASRSDRNTSAGGSENVAISGGPATLNTNANTGTENRPRNVALALFVKL